MRHGHFYRNVRARDLLDSFLVSSITSLLLVRFYLHLTNYPQLGGGSLHIAHMLYGGLFMMVAIVMCLAFLGAKTRQLAAIIGGVGFGIFIDELGKFITADNNYFFRPAIGLIYAIFVALYLTFNFLTRSQKLSSREYQLNALVELEEAIADDLDKSERSHIHALLDASDQRSNMTKKIRALVEDLDVTAQTKHSKISSILKKIDTSYQHFWEQRHSSNLIKAIFVAEALLITLGTLYTIATNVDDISAFFNGSLTYGRELIIGQVAASIVAGGFVLYGLTKLNDTRYQAFEQFRRATLINIYLVQFFVFIRLQFEALPGLLLSVILLILINFVMYQERKLGKTRDIS